MMGGVQFITFLRRKKLIGGVAVLSITQLLASLAGLLRENVLARVFEHDLSVVDAYIAGFNPSDLLFQTCVVSAMGTVLVPVLASYRSSGNHEEVQRVLSGTIGVTAVLFGCIAVLLCIFFPYLTPLFNIHFTGATYDLYVQFGRLALLSNFLFVFGNAYGQYLVTVERYWIYGITPVLYTLGTITGAVFLTPVIGPYGPMVGTIGGAVIYVILRMIAVHRHGCPLSISLWHPDLLTMGKMMLPRILSLGALQLQLMYLNGFASSLTKGAVTINNYARNFESVLVGVIGISIAQAVYSRLSQTAVQRDKTAFSMYYTYGGIGTFLVCTAGAVVLAAMAPIAAQIVHLQGAGIAFTLTLSLYAIAAPLESVTHIQYRALYALKDTVTPAFIGVSGGAVALITGWALIDGLHIYALPIAFVAGEFLQAGALALAVPLRMRKLQA